MMMCHDDMEAEHDTWREHGRTRKQGHRLAGVSMASERGSRQAQERCNRGGHKSTVVHNHAEIVAKTKKQGVRGGQGVSGIPSQE